MTQIRSRFLDLAAHAASFTGSFPSLDLVTLPSEVKSERAAISDFCGSLLYLFERGIFRSHSLEISAKHVSLPELFEEVLDLVHSPVPRSCTQLITKRNQLKG